MDEALRASGLRHYRDIAATPEYIARRLTPPAVEGFELDLKHLGMFAALLHCATSTGAPLRVLDFGGGLGLHYRRLEPLLPDGCVASWSIVELPEVVAGTHTTPPAALRYFTSLEAFAAAQGRADVCLVSGTLQTLESPFSVLHALAASGHYVLLVSIPLTGEDEDFIAVGDGAEPYPLWFFSGRQFETQCRNAGLRVRLAWSNPDTTWLVNGRRTPAAHNVLLEPLS